MATTTSFPYKRNAGDHKLWATPILNQCRPPPYPARLDSYHRAKERPDLCDYDEASLARKLAEKWHLNVAERKSLPFSGMAASTFVAAIREILKASPWYPPDWPRDEPLYDGVVITPTERGFMIHERHEIGVMRFSDATIRNVATLEDAVRAFLKATFKLGEIDGIRIDWTC